MLLLDMMKKVPGIQVAHVNYNYRVDSIEDEMLVAKTCQDLGIKAHFLSTEKYDGSGFEAWARKVRYDFFKSIGYTTLYTAHNANDQAETVIMNRRRGCGLYGLGGMRETERHRRPLLQYTKGEIYDMAIERGVKWREDSTNTDTSFLRNRIRSGLTDLRSRLISNYAAVARESHEMCLLDAYMIYGKPKTDGTETIFKSPSAVPSGNLYSEEYLNHIWVTMFHYHVKDLVSYTKKHTEMILSSEKNTRVIGLGNGYYLRKKKSVFILSRS